MYSDLTIGAREIAPHRPPWTLSKASIMRSLQGVCFGISKLTREQRLQLLTLARPAGGF